MSLIARLLRLPSGSFIDPALIRGIVRFAGKGVVFRNEYSKIIVFERESDPINLDVIATVVGNIVNSGRDWQQPDWPAEFAKAHKAAEQKTTLANPAKVV